MKHVGVALIAMVIAAGLLVSACGGPDESAKPAQGVVRGVDRDNTQITIEHGDIPDLMKAMTMTFEVSDAGLLDDIDDGDQIDFRVRYADGVYTVTSINPR
jgi:Cu/Ag efflux protein CusF